jgi:hypothetical protein
MNSVGENLHHKSAKGAPQYFEHFFDLKPNIGIIFFPVRDIFF